MVLLRNKFSQCATEDHSSGGKVLECLNMMGDRHRYFVHNNKFAMCEYHACVILDNRHDNSHDTVSCSGAILRFDDDMYYFNPLTPFGLNFDKMLPLTNSAIDYFSVHYQYYFQADVRSKFTEEIIDLNCTNAMKTCLTFTNHSLCFGNVEDTTIIHSTESLIHGIIVAFSLGALCYLFLRDKTTKYPLSFVFAFYILPLIGLGMAYNGFFLAMSIPYLMGNAVVLFIFIILYYPLRDLNEYISNLRERQKIQSRY